jgi:uncharacterized protein (DUF1015 family)
VTEIRAFPAHLVRPEWAARVVSPMHDAMRPEQRESVRRSNPDSYLHVTMRQDDPDGGGDPEQMAVRSMAALTRLLDAGAFRSFDDPSVYAYQLRAKGHIQTGLVVEVPVAAFAAGEVRGHENVQPARVSALQRHLEAVPARSDPVALMHRPNAALTDIMRSATDAEPVLQIDPDPDVGQSVWRLTDPNVTEAISSALATEVLYVADGHHRVAASVAAWKDQGCPDQGAILCVAFPTDQLEIRAFHRRVRGPIDVGDLRAGLAADFTLDAIAAPSPERGTVEVYAGGEWLRAVPRITQRPAGAEGFDVALLHRDILGPLLGLADPADVRIEYVSDLEPIEGLVERSDMDDGAVFALAPPTVADLLDVADRGEIVAPKSTYFHPKPRSGVFVRLLGSVPGDREPKEQGWHHGNA